MPVHPRYTFNTITALTAAAPGWRVVVKSPSSGDRVACPIVAWAAQAHPDECGDPEHAVHPVFVLDGRTWTVGDLDQIIRTDARVLAPGEQP